LQAPVIVDHLQCFSAVPFRSSSTRKPNSFHQQIHFRSILKRQQNINSQRYPASIGDDYHRESKRLGSHRDHNSRRARNNLKIQNLENKSQNFRRALTNDYQLLTAFCICDKKPFSHQGSKGPDSQDILAIKSLGGIEKRLRCRSQKNCSKKSSQIDWIDFLTRRRGVNRQTVQEHKNLQLGEKETDNRRSDKAIVVRSKTDTSAGAYCPTSAFNCYQPRKLTPVHRCGPTAPTIDLKLAIRSISDQSQLVASANGSQSNIDRSVLDYKRTSSNIVEETYPQFQNLPYHYYPSVSDSNSLQRPIFKLEVSVCSRQSCTSARSSGVLT
jgi:hypothetical protein